MTNCDNKEVNNYMRQMKMNGHKHLHLIRFCDLSIQANVMFSRRRKDIKVM